MIIRKNLYCFEIKGEKEAVKVRGKKQDVFKNWPLIENPHFLSNLYETW